MKKGNRFREIDLRNHEKSFFAGAVPKRYAARKAIFNAFQLKSKGRKVGDEPETE